MGDLLVQKINFGYKHLRNKLGWEWDVKRKCLLGMLNCFSKGKFNITSRKSFSLTLNLFKQPTCCDVEISPATNIPRPSGNVRVV